MNASDDATHLARSIFKFRQARSDVLPTELFGEFGWDMLLVLFIADADGRQIRGHDVAKLCNVRPIILSRWMLHLTSLGLIVGDGDGDLNDMLTLSARGLEAIEQLMLLAGNLRDGQPQDA